MEIIDILTNEHKLIRQYIDDIEVVLDLMKHNMMPGREFFDNGVEFTRSFSDRYHHYKEEYIMFAKMAEKKGGEIDAQVMFLRDQHERARDFTSRIAASLDYYTKGDSIYTSRLIENLGYYGHLLKEHIHREDHIFYPMAEKMFSEAEAQELLAEFDKAEKKFDENILEVSRRLVEEMSALLEAQFADNYTRRIEALPKKHE